MPVTIQPVYHRARQVSTSSAIPSSEALLEASCPAEHRRCKSIIRSSIAGSSAEASILSSSNGFVRAAMDAYSDHHHLTIRPEDIWFAILTQLSFFVNAHAEELRSFFVSHADRKELVVKGIGNIETANFGLMAQKMTLLMAKNLNDPELLPWIMPDFSTTENTDKIVASILMMGAMQQYFSYRFELACGIPSVTLLGERADWEEILQRLEKLPNLGSEPGQFYRLLKPVLTHFVASFDSAPAPSTIDFWQNIAHESGGSGPHYLSGWITAFCFWNENGKSLYEPSGPEVSDRVKRRRFGENIAGCKSDGIRYHHLNTNDIPAGFTSVPVKLNDNGKMYDTIMVAGSMGIQVTSSGQLLEERDYQYNRRRGVPDSATPTVAPGPDSMQPVSGWMMYEKVDDENKNGEPDEISKRHLEGKQSLDVGSKGQNDTGESASGLKASQGKKRRAVAAAASYLRQRLYGSTVSPTSS